MQVHAPADEIFAQIQIRRWEEALRRTAEDPEFRAIAARDYIVVRHMDRATMTRFVEAQATTYGEIWRTTPWRAP